MRELLEQRPQNDISFLQSPAFYLAYFTDTILLIRASGQKPWFHLLLPLFFKSSQNFIQSKNGSKVFIGPIIVWEFLNDFSSGFNRWKIGRECLNYAGKLENVVIKKGIISRQIPDSSPTQQGASELISGLTQSFTKCVYPVFSTLISFNLSSHLLPTENNRTAPLKTVVKKKTIGSWKSNVVKDFFTYFSKTRVLMASFWQLIGHWTKEQCTAQFFSYVGVSQPAQVMFVFSEITSEMPA